MPEEAELTLSDGTIVTKGVTWDTSEVPLVGNCTITGTVADYNRTFEHTVSIIPDKMIYFYDSASRNVLGEEEADYLTLTRAVLKKQLRNTGADEDYADTEVSGYKGVRSSENSSSYDVGYKNAGSDIWGHGFWAAGSKTIDYAFTLEAGEYTIATGYQEWWNTSRPTEIAVTDGDGSVLGTHDFTLSSSDSARLETISVSVSDATTITVSIAKTGSPDPVLSFIAVVKDSMDKEKEDLGYTDGRWYTKWGSTYYETADGEKLSGINKIDGVYYSFSNKGAMQKSVFVTEGANTYYFGSDGKMVTGWMTKWTAVYYFDENGVMQTGFIVIDGKTYHFSNKGAMSKSTWVTVDGVKYYIKADGTMAVDETITKWGKKYSFDAEGHLI